MRKVYITLLLLLFIVNAFSQETEKITTEVVIEKKSSSNIENGEKLFKANCTACHKPDRILIGPALKGVAAKYENDITYITSFVNNSQAVIASGEPRAVAIYEAFNKQVMTNFEMLNSQDVTDILAYADSFTKAKTDGISIRPLSPKPKSHLRPLYLQTNFGIWMFYGIGVLLLIAALYFLVVLNDLIAKRKKKEN